MKHVKKLTVWFCIALLSGALLTACGKKEENKEDASGTEGSSRELEEIVVGASIEPHATILNSPVVKKQLEAEGFKIKVVEYTDYIQPNSATEDGSLDANFFQHLPYLKDFNEKNGTHLVSAAEIHFEPLGIYPGKAKTLEDISDGAKIAVPNDATNEARALLLLEKAGFIKLQENIGLDATVKDILENPHEIQFYEVEAAQAAKVLPDVEYSVINGNYALSAGLSAGENGLLVEDESSEAAKTYINVIVVKEGNEETAKTKALVKAVTSEETKKFIEEQWKGAVVPVF